MVVTTAPPSRPRPTRWPSARRGTAGTVSLSERMSCSVSLIASPLIRAASALRPRWTDTFTSDSPMSARGRGLGHAEPFDMRVADRARLLGAEAREQAIHVHPRRARLLEPLCDQDRLDILDRHRDLPPPEMIDHPIARDRVEPGGERAIAIVAGAAGVDGDQRFLHQILDILLGATQPPPVEGAQQR